MTAEFESACRPSALGTALKFERPFSSAQGTPERSFQNLKNGEDAKAYPQAQQEIVRVKRTETKQVAQGRPAQNGRQQGGIDTEDRPQRPVGPQQRARWRC